jgi:hypothetical protein
MAYWGYWLSMLSNKERKELEIYNNKWCYFAALPLEKIKIWIK